MKTIITWIKVSKSMPKSMEWVLVTTPYCTTPFCWAKWNGQEWKDDQGVVIQNVEFWANKPI